MQALLALLARHPSIVYAEPNYTVRAFSTPNDESYPQQWNFQLINMEAAWDTSTGDGVTVAVLDSGISPYGNDGFGDRLLEGYNAFLNIKSRWQDFHSHGTHVAGTIGQETNNGTGVAGIAYSAWMLPVKVLNRYGLRLKCHAGRRHSLGRRQWCGYHQHEPWRAQRADGRCRKPLSMPMNKGLFIVAASGNDASADTLTPVSYPAAYEQVIAVGAVDSMKNRAYYSNGGPELALVAPGGSRMMAARTAGNLRAPSWFRPL